MRTKLMMKTGVLSLILITLVNVHSFAQNISLVYDVENMADSHGGITLHVTVSAGVTGGTRSTVTEVYGTIYPNPANTAISIGTDLDLSQAGIRLPDLQGAEVQVAVEVSAKERRQTSVCLQKGFTCL